MKHIKKHPVNDKAQDLSKDIKKQDHSKPASKKKLDADKSLSDPKVSMKTSKPSNRKLDGEKFLANPTINTRKGNKPSNKNLDGEKFLSENHDLPEGMEVGGLKCDNPDCEWNDMSIPFSDYEKSINKTCPECGENLLTQENYDQIIQIKQTMELLASYSEDEINALVANLSEDEMDQALDMMNKLKMKKKGEDAQGKQSWSIGESKKLKNIKRFNEEFDRDGYDSHWNKFEQWLSQKDFELYDGREDIYNKFMEVANDDNLSSEEKAEQITDYLDEKWGTHDGYMEVYDYLESLFMDEI
jgi:hypothetical protein